MNFGLLNKKRVIPIFFPWGEFEDSSSKEHFERVFFIKLEKRNGNRLENEHVFSFSEKDLPFLNSFNFVQIFKKKCFVRLSPLSMMKRNHLLYPDKESKMLIQNITAR